MADGILTPCNVARSWHWFRQVTAPCNVAYVALESWQWIHQVAALCNVIRSSRIMTLNSPGGSTLQCGRWLWDDMPLNSPKRPLYWNSTPGFDFDHITTVDISFCTSLRNFIQIGPPSAKNDVMSISRWRISAILDFKDPVMGSLKNPITTSYRSSMDIIDLNCLVFEKIAFFAVWRQTDKQTDGQHRCAKPLSLSRAAA